MATSALLTACKGNDNKSTAAKEPPKGKMTYRTNPKTGEKVSILGYGMMRLPVVGGNAKKKGGEITPIDQEMVNRQIDYALERRQLLRHVTSLLPGTVGACHGHCPEAPSAQQILHCHQAL